MVCLGPANSLSARYPGYWVGALAVYVPPPRSLPASKIVSLDGEAVTLLLANEDLGWRGWFCGDFWPTKRNISVARISALRITPGYLAVYLKPHHLAVDVWFDKKDTVILKQIPESVFVCHRSSITC
jgi:hypothetical protein